MCYNLNVKLRCQKVKFAVGSEYRNTTLATEYKTLRLDYRDSCLAL